MKHIPMAEMETMPSPRTVTQGDERPPPALCPCCGRFAAAVRMETDGGPAWLRACPGGCAESDPRGVGRAEGSRQPRRPRRGATPPMLGDEGGGRRYRSRRRRSPMAWDEGRQAWVGKEGEGA